jgi:hypothetical protein
MQYGALPASDASFRAACLMLARHPAYARAPLARVLEIRAQIARRQTFAAVDGGELVGFIAWQPISTEDAVTAIRARRWHGKASVGDAGALLLTAFLAPSKEGALPFFRRLVASRKGKLMVMERHFRSRPPRLLWVDRSGKLEGDDLPELAQHH